MFVIPMFCPALRQGKRSIAAFFSPCRRAQISARKNIIAMALNNCHATSTRTKAAETKKTMELEPEIVQTNICAHISCSGSGSGSHRCAAATAAAAAWQQQHSRLSDVALCDTKQGTATKQELTFCRPPAAQRVRATTGRIRASPRPHRSL